MPIVFAQQGYLDSGQHWNISPGQTINYRIFQGGSPDIPDNSEITAIQAAFQTWENDAGSYVDFTYGGLTATRASLQSGRADGVNVVDFINMGSDAGFVVAVYRSPLSGNPLTECDMLFNEFYTFSTNLAPNTFDVQNLATHEAGHFLRLLDLYDNDDSEQTMYGYVAFQETIRRTLEWGDVAGARYIYPNRYLVGGGSLGWETQGADVAVGNINGAGLTDLVTLWVDNPSGENSIKYRFG